jgi:hypothetical protein
MNLCHLVGAFLMLLLDESNEIGAKAADAIKNKIPLFGNQGPKQFWKYVKDANGNIILNPERTDQVRKQHPLIIIM